MPSPTEPLKLFYSYAHEDEELRDALAQQLSVMQRQGVISSWHDREISAGDEWRGEINDQLESAQIVLLLISPAFVASDYCYDIEMKRAMERHKAGQARVIPVILRPVDWQGTPFRELQSLPKNGKPVTTWPNLDEALLDVAKGIRRAAVRMTAPPHALGPVAEPQPQPPLVAGSPSLSPEPLSATPAEITAPPGGPPELDIPRQTAAGWIGSLRLRKSAIICAVAAALTLALLSMTSLRWLDFLSMDLLFALRGAQAPPEEIVVVAIDDASFEELRLRWPWPRDLHAKLIDALFRAGVKAVAFDVHFAQPSSDPGQDAALAAAVNDHPAVVLSGKYQVTGYATGDSYSWIPPAETVLAPESESGFLNASDPDGVVRLIPTMLAGRPSLSLLAAETYLEQTVGRGKPDRLQVPAELLINFVGPAHSVDTISYYRALDPERFALGTSLEDKLAFVGLASNEIQADYRPTPFTRSGHGLMYGVEIHANAAHNLLQGNFLTEPHPVVLSSVSFLIATLSGILLFSMNPRRSGALFTGVCVASVSASFVVFARYNLAVSVSKLIGPLLVVFLTSLWYRYNDIYRSEQRIRRILAGQRVRMQEGDGIKTAVRVFVSYNDEEEDAKYAAAILDYVKGLNNEGVEFWSKRDLITGDAKIEEIQERIDSSCMAMVLVSQSYLNCRDCVDIELRRILTKRLTVFPIILSPCDWESQPWLSSLKVLPNRNETFAAHYRERASRDQILLQVLKDLRKRVRKVSR